jgi:hypothetical protein
VVVGAVRSDRRRGRGMRAGRRRVLCDLEAEGSVERAVAFRARTWGRELGGVCVCVCVCVIDEGKRSAGSSHGGQLHS